ncbi:MAG: hypothetical protein JWO46_130 [Nocardioidaceae bacterium]|nr:hypothetical protein [Nocardioidaceae bacterium]
MHVSRIGLALLKGTRHLGLDVLTLDASGPVGDRAFCLVDVEQRRVLRSVENPSLVAVRASYDGSDLALALPDGSTLSAAPRDSGDELKADYWGRTALLRLQDGPHAALLGDYLGRPVVLARVEPGEVVYGGAVTLVTTAALSELAARAARPELAHQDARFRATLTVESERDLDGLAPGTMIRVGTATLEVRGRVPRCAVVDRDPVSGEKTAPVLATLAGYRRGAGEVWFGLDARVVEPGQVVPGAPVVPVDAWED